MFIGVLAGSVFSGSGAFADVTYNITSQADLEAIGITVPVDGNYVVTESFGVGARIGDTYVTETFNGTFNGRGFTISGLTKPLFSAFDTAARIFNLKLDTAESGVTGNGILSNTASTGTVIDNVHVTGDVEPEREEGEFIEGAVGGLVGDNDGGTISNSSATGDVHGNNYLGGLVGYNGGTITNSHATGDVSGNNYLGGLVGASLGSITNSYAEGNVTSAVNINPVNDDSNLDVVDTYVYNSTLSGSYLGGLVGYSNGSISDSWAEGDVSSTVRIESDFGDVVIDNSVSSGSFIGGLVGESHGSISDSWAEGDVSSTVRIESDFGDVVIDNSVSSGSFIGGLVGESLGSISNSHAEGNVISSVTIESGVNISSTSVAAGDSVGGLVGYSFGDITNSWAEGDVSSQLILTYVGVFTVLDGLQLTDGDNVGGLAGYSSGEITNSRATGDVIGGGEYIGGLVGDAYGTIEDSYATGDVTGTGVDNVDFHGIGGLIGYLGGYLNNSYATGVVRGFAEIGGLVGSLGAAGPYISNSHATGDVYGEEFVGGLVGKLDSGQSVSNAYATGDVTGYGDYIGGLVGASDGTITNSYATGDVTGSTYVGGLAGASFSGSVLNSFATGDVDGGASFDNFIGSIGGSAFVDDVSRAFSKSSPDAPSILSVVNTAGTAGEPAFEILACKNNGLPLLSDLIDSYENTCTGSNSGLRIYDFIQTTSITEIAKTLGFVISPKFPNDPSIGFIKSEKELAISKILGLQKAADRVARTFVKTGEALQISYDFDSKDPIELWVKLPDGKWVLSGVISFDKNGKAVLPPKHFKMAGEYVLVLNKPSEDSVKANAPLNQIGSLTVFVN